MVPERHRMKEAGGRATHWTWIVRILSMQRTTLEEPAPPTATPAKVSRGPEHSHGQPLCRRGLCGWTLGGHCLGSALKSGSSLCAALGLRLRGRPLVWHVGGPGFQARPL